MRQGEELDIIGPLGNGFSLPLPANSVILVGGGVGVAPLLFLAEKLVQAKHPVSQILVLIGAKKKESVLCEEEFRKLGIEVCIANEDGNSGFKGTVCNLLKEILNTDNNQATTIYASGPQAMLEQTAHISREKEISCELSLEEIIACGLGVCYGCAVKTKQGLKQICQDGPVFELNDIDSLFNFYLSKSGKDYYAEDLSLKRLVLSPKASLKIREFPPIVNKIISDIIGPAIADIGNKEVLNDAFYREFNANLPPRIPETGAPDLPGILKDILR